jgi:DNA-directed RNA polymerase specialized sigma24 family protein
VILRPRLHGIAYRMLGTRSDADDIVQEACLRRRQVDAAEVRSGEAWLVTVVTRLAMDLLRHAAVERRHDPVANLMHRRRYGINQSRRPGRLKRQDARTARTR